MKGALFIARYSLLTEGGGVASMINVKQVFSNFPRFFLFQEMRGTATFLFRG
jgi:hypothetical protein